MRNWGGVMSITDYKLCFELTVRNSSYPIEYKDKNDMWNIPINNDRKTGES